MSVGSSTGGCAMLAWRRTLCRSQRCPSTLAPTLLAVRSIPWNSAARRSVGHAYGNPAVLGRACWTMGSEGIARVEPIAVAQPNKALEQTGDQLLYLIPSARGRRPLSARPLGV